MGWWRRGEGSGGDERGTCDVGPHVGSGRKRRGGGAELKVERTDVSAAEKSCRGEIGCRRIDEGRGGPTSGGDATVAGAAAWRVQAPPWGQRWQGDLCATRQLMRVLESGQRPRRCWPPWRRLRSVILNSINRVQCRRSGEGMGENRWGFLGPRARSSCLEMKAPAREEGVGPRAGGLRGRDSAPVSPRAWTLYPEASSGIQ